MAFLWNSNPCSLERFANPAKVFVFSLFRKAAAFGLCTSSECCWKLDGLRIAALFERGVRKYRRLLLEQCWQQGQQVIYETIELVAPEGGVIAQSLAFRAGVFIWAPYNKRLNRTQGQFVLL